MTTFMDWSCWTHIIIGQDRASAGLIVDLDFRNRRVTYKRETGNCYSECPHPYGTEEYERYLYDTVEAQFDHVWVDPNKRVVLGKDENESLRALKKPASFLELTDVDPRDYFGGEVKVTSTYAPHLLALSLPQGARIESNAVVSEPRDSQKALEDFRQLQRNIVEGLCTQTEALWQSIWHLGAIDDLGAAWKELNPWIGIEVRSTLRRALVGQKDGKPMDGVSPAMAFAVSRVASWAEQACVLSPDPAFEFMSQPPELILEFVRLNMGKALPDPGMTWYGLAGDARQNAHESADARVWLSIAIDVYEWLASQKPDADHSSPKRDEMIARAQRLHHASANPIERELDRKVIVEWFFRNESMAPSQAAICPRDWFKQTADERTSQSRIRQKLRLFEMLDKWGEPVPDRIREWLALLPHLR
jgi:hypothetical protein